MDETKIRARGRSEGGKPSGRGAWRQVLLYGGTAAVVMGVWFVVQMKDSPPPIPPDVPETGQAAPSPLMTESAPDEPELQPEQESEVPPETAAASSRQVLRLGMDEPEGGLETEAGRERYSQQIRMFEAEARETLPIIGMRSFNPRQARQQLHTASAEDASTSARARGTTSPSSATALEGTVSEGNDSESPDPNAALEASASQGEGQTVTGTDDPRDDRGLTDGEVWIRIDPSQSGQYKEVMAQTADLYRANTDYTGDVKVLLWVGGQVWAKEVY